MNKEDHWRLGFWYPLIVSPQRPWLPADSWSSIQAGTSDSLPQNVHAAFSSAQILAHRPAFTAAWPHFLGWVPKFSSCHSLSYIILVQRIPVGCILCTSIIQKGMTLGASCRPWDHTRAHTYTHAHNQESCDDRSNNDVQTSLGASDRSHRAAHTSFSLLTNSLCSTILNAVTGFPVDLQKHARAVSLQQCDAFTKIFIVKGLLIVPSKSQALFIRQYPVRG